MYIYVVYYVCAGLMSTELKLWQPSCFLAYHHSIVREEWTISTSGIRVEKLCLIAELIIINCIKHAKLI